jgi:hypothetical protein
MVEPPERIFRDVGLPPDTKHPKREPSQVVGRTRNNPHFTSRIQ